MREEEPHAVHRHGCIYRVTHTPSGKCYIGQTKRKASVRWYFHLNASKKVDSRQVVFHRALRKYPADQWKWEVLFCLLPGCTQDDLSDLERHFGETNDALVPSGFTMQLGNIGGYPHTEESRAKISASTKGKPKSPEAREKIAAALRKRNAAGKGKRHTPEHNAKIAASLLGKEGRPHTEEAKKKISAAKKGRSLGPCSDSRRANISAALKGRTGTPWTEERRRKQSEALKGVPRTPEVREKIAASNRRRAEERRQAK